MFYPFNSRMAEKTTKDAQRNKEEEKFVLLNAYLEIAHVYITWAAHMGRNKTSVYYPYEICEDFAEALRSAGFSVTSHTLPNRMWVSWEE